MRRADVKVVPTQRYTGQKQAEPHHLKAHCLERSGSRSTSSTKYNGMQHQDRIFPIKLDGEGTGGNTNGGTHEGVHRQGGIRELIGVTLKGELAWVKSLGFALRRCNSFLRFALRVVRVGASAWAGRIFLGSNIYLSP